MNDPKQRFLQAEEQATRIVEQLQQLKLKMDAHEEASVSLAGARESIATLTSELADIARGMQSATRKLAEVGTPGILQSIDTAAEELGSKMLAGNETLRRLHLLSVVLGVATLVAVLILILR